MKKFFIVAVTVLLVVCFTFPTAAFAGTEGTGSESPPTTQAPGDTTATTVSPETTLPAETTTSTDTTIATDESTTTTDTTVSSETTLPADTTTSTDTTIATDESTTTTDTTIATDESTTSTETTEADTTPPVITLNGDAVINLKIGDTFTDPGATATDNKDASVAVTTTGSVNTNFASSYTLSYNASDAAGNAAVAVTRTVKVASIATVVTDKPDYLPNDYVLVTGSGWLPGETVKLDFSETLFDPPLQQTITYYTVADSEGNIRDLQYLIEMRHSGASFILKATGQTSGLTAQTNFTDGAGTATIIIDKNVYKPDGSTIDSDDVTSFTIELYKTQYLSTTLFTTVNLKSSDTPASISVPTNTGWQLITYSVKEVSNSNYNTSYDPLTASVIITPTNGSSTTVTVKNTQKVPSTITIKKEVYKSDGITLDTSDLTTFSIELWKVGTPSDTKVTTVNLQGGQTSAAIDVSPGNSYYAVETSNPDYTTTIDPAGAVTVTNGSSNTITVKNTQKAPNTVIIKKEVYKSDGITLDTSDSTTFTIDLWKVGTPDTKVNLTPITLQGGQTSAAIDVSPGSSYYVVETPNPDYTTAFDPSGISGNSGIITVVNGTTNTFTVKNTQKVSSTITIKKEVYKSDGITLDTSDLTTFSIELWKVGTPSDTKVTTVNLQGGQTSAAIDVSPGNSYYAVETSNPNYTTTIDPTGAITVTNGSSNTITVKNKSKAATITVYKNVFKPDGTPDPADLTTFEVTLKKLVGLSSVTIGTKTVSQLSPAVFDTEIPAAGSGNLYWVEETSNSNYTKSGDGFLNSQTIKQEESKSFTIGNTQNGNSFTVTKTGLEFNSDLTDFFYDRAKFTLYDPSGAIVKTNSGADSITLDCSDSILSIYSDNYTWNKLSNGTGYKLVESYDVSPANRTTYSSSLAGNQYFFNITGSDESVAVVNYPNGSVSAYKTDKALIPLAGAQIGLFANINDASPIMPAVTSSGVSGSPNVVFLDVPTGGTTGMTYYIHEISAPAGYTADPVWYAINISDADLSPTLSTRIINKADGSITLYKKDSLGNALAGAVFGLYTAEDESLTPITVMSDINGEVKFTELTCGLTYYIREISPPSGFVPDENWYPVTITVDSPHYTFTDPVINTAGGTITVTKNVIAPDGKTDVDDAKEFTITLEKKDGGNWVAVKTAKIKEGSPVVFYVPLNISYKVVETADTKYTETDKAGEVTLTTQGQNVDIGLINKQHYALIVMGKIIYQWNSLLPNIITDDDHIFFTKLEGGHPSLIEWHPIATKIPTVFLVWPGTYTVVEKSDVNYNNNGQPVILSGFDLSDFNLADLGDVGNLVSILFQNLLNGGGTSQEITVEGDDISPLIIANKYTPQYGTVTVTKDVVKPDGSDVSDPKEFNVKLQRLSLTLPNILDMLDLSNVSNVNNLSDLMNILDLTGLANLSNLVGWEDVGTPQNVSEGNNVTFNGVEKDHIYRVVETQATGYMQMSGILPFYFDPENTNEQVDIINRQEMIIIKVVKNVIGADGSDVSDNHEFWVKLNGGSPTLYHPFSEDCPTVFAVLPGTYTAVECSESNYNLTDNGGTFTVKTGDGTICDPYILTVTNKQKPGSITITKTVVGGSDSAEFTVTGPNSYSNTFTLASGGSQLLSDLAWGSYTVTETALSGYQTPSFVVNGGAPVTGSSVTVALDADRCQSLKYKIDVTNTAAPGSLTVTKTVIGGSDSATFNVDGPGANDFNFTLASGGSWSNNSLPWGSYTVTETSMSGYQTPSFVINGGAPSATGSVTVVIGNGVSQALTYRVDVTNTVIPGSITITKTVVGGTDSAEFTITGPNSYSNTFTLAPGGSQTLNDLAWGSYTVTETSMSGYQTPSFVVNGGAPVAASSVNIVIGNGAAQALTYTVDVTNTVIPGSITITNTVVGGNDSSEFTVTGPEGYSNTFTLASGGSQTLNDLAWGSYTITETPMSGYQTPSFVINGGEPVATSSVTVVIGNGVIQTQSLEINGRAPVAASFVKAVISIGATPLTYTVDVTNTAIRGSLTINKLGMAAGDSIEFVIAGPGGFSQTLTLTAAPGATIASATINNLLWGDYTISETLKPNYSFTPSFVVTAGFNMVQNSTNSVTVTIPGTANNARIVDATLTVTNAFTTPTTGGASTSTEVLGLATFEGENVAPESGRIDVLGITELPFTGQNIMIILAGILLMAVLSLILVLSLRKKAAK